MEKWFLLLVSKKGQEKDKGILLTRYGGIIVTIISMWKYQIVSKVFAAQCFFTDHVNHKSVNKTTGRTLSVNPSNLCVHQLKGFQMP